MIHFKWDIIIHRFIREIQLNLGGSIFDNRCGKYWDPGQSICAELYGPNWFKTEAFDKLNHQDDSCAPDDDFFNVAQRMARGYTPDWAKRKV